MEKRFTYTGQQIVDEMATKESQVRTLINDLRKLYSSASKPIEDLEKDWAEDSRESVKAVYKVYLERKKELEQLKNSEYSFYAQLR